MSERQREQLSAATGLVFVGLILAAAGVGFWFPGWSAEFDSTAQDRAAPGLPDARTVVARNGSGPRY